MALAFALCVGSAALVRFAGRRGTAAPPAPHAPGRLLRRALGPGLRRPGRVLAIAVAVAVIGLVLETRSEVSSDIRRLVPQDLPALRDLDAVEGETGV